MNSSNPIITFSINEEKLVYVKAFLNALKIKFDISKPKSYDKSFVEMIQKGEEDLEKGLGKKIKSTDINDLWS